MELDAKVTTVPAVGAGPLRVTVPVADPPPVTRVGERVRDLSAGAVMLREAVAVEVPRVAVSVAVIEVETAEVATEKLATVAPPATVTVAGTTALVVLELSLTVIPPAGATLPRVTVPVVEVPPITEVGATLSEEIVGALIVRAALALLP